MVCLPARLVYFPGSGNHRVLTLQLWLCPGFDQGIVLTLLPCSSGDATKGQLRGWGDQCTEYHKLEVGLGLLLPFDYWAKI